MSDSRQNTSPAVMQQRDRARTGLDYYPTPPWVGRVLCHELEARELKSQAGSTSGPITCWEPACGSGDLARGLAPYFDAMITSDIHAHSRLAEGADIPIIGDFLIDGLWRNGDVATTADWIITNPPFKLAPRFVATALRRANVGVAMFVRTSFLEGAARLRDLFQPMPPALVLQFAARVPLFEGKLRDPSQKYWDPKADNGPRQPKGKLRIPSTATAYCWVIWVKDDHDSRIGWIPPCHLEFTAPGDYPPSDVQPHDDRGQLPLSPVRAGSTL